MSRWIFGALAFILSFSALAQSQGDPNKYSTTPGNPSCRFFDGFADNGDGTVTDPRNGLVWKRCAEGMTWNGSACIGGDKKMNWLDAMQAAKDSRILGRDDWRLPSKEEFLNVVGSFDQGCRNNNEEKRQYAVPGALAWPAKRTGWFWSYSPYQGDSAGAWGASFHTGDVSYSLRNGDYRVRLVRASHSDGAAALSAFNSEYNKFRKEGSNQANACSRLSPGDTGTVRGPSRLSSDVGYVVRYVNAAKGTITIEATNSGQLNLNRGEMRQVSCGDVASDGRIEIYYK